MNIGWTKTYVGQGLDCCFVKFDIVELDMFCQLDERRRCRGKRGENWVQSQNCLWLVTKDGHTKCWLLRWLQTKKARQRFIIRSAGESTPRLGVLFIQGRSQSHTRAKHPSIASTPTLTASSTLPTQNVSPSPSATHTDVVRRPAGIRLQCLWLDARSHTRMGCNSNFRFLSCCLRIPLT